MRPPHQLAWERWWLYNCSLVLSCWNAVEASSLTSCRSSGKTNWALTVDMVRRVVMVRDWAGGSKEGRHKRPANWTERRVAPDNMAVHA